MFFFDVSFLIFLFSFNLFLNSVLALVILVLQLNLLIFTYSTFTSPMLVDVFHAIFVFQLYDRQLTTKKKLYIFFTITTRIEIHFYQLWLAILIYIIILII